MNGMIRAVVLMSLLATAFVISAEEMTLSGKVTCSLCRGRHDMGIADPAACARACVKNGAKYVLMHGEQIYPLPGDPKQFDYYAEKNVTIRVEIEEGRIVKIDAISVQP